MYTRYAGGFPLSLNLVRFLNADLPTETRRPQSSSTAVINLLKFGAMFATIVSIGVAMYAGWYQGGLTVERGMSVSIGCVAVLYVHMLPAARQALAGLARPFAFVLWVVGLIVVLYGQVTFVLISRQHAGDQRAAMVPTTTPGSRGEMPARRTLTEIAQDNSKAQIDLARMEVRPCDGDCQRIKVRRTILAAQIATLEAEASEVRRHEAAEDRRNRLADQEAALRADLRADPVARQVAAWFGTTEGGLELLLAIACSVVLEGAAITGWLLVSVVSSRVSPCGVVVSGRNETAPEQREGASGLGIASDDCPEPISNREVISTDDVTVIRDPGIDTGCSDEDLRQLRVIHRAVVAGHLRPTQAAIRGFLKCGQSKAGRLKREYEVQFGGVLDHGGQAHAR
ncbi:hypothetical protein [Burkholderia sp. LMG 21824]|uniref:hypothetical protein n=1 Tax=Burkholderia sp. LMG 21824 TaxID=3158172 RepID=UPI003C2D699A